VGSVSLNQKKKFYTPLNAFYSLFVYLSKERLEREKKRERGKERERER